MIHQIKNHKPNLQIRMNKTMKKNNKNMNSKNTRMRLWIKSQRLKLNKNHQKIRNRKQRKNKQRKNKEMIYMQNNFRNKK